MKVISQITMSEAHEQSIIVQHISFVDYLHNHKEIQISYIYEGSGSVIIGNSIKQFKAGDIFIIGADLPHLFKSADGVQAHVRSLSIYFEYKKALVGLFSVAEMQQIKKFLENADYGFQVPGQYIGQAIVFLSKMAKESGLNRLIQTIKLLRFFVNIQGWKPLSTGVYNYSFDGTERLNSIYQFTMEHYHEDITLARVASEACMTTHAFCKYFKKYTRKTYLNFLNEYRVSQACKKLISDKYDSIASVAYATGFSNIITFNRVFKKALNLTPSEYLEQFKSKESQLEIKKIVNYV